MTSRIAEIINSYPPLAFTSHPALVAELEAEVARARVDALKKAAMVCSDIGFEVNRVLNLRPMFNNPAFWCADAIAALAKEPAAPDLTSPSQSAIIQGE